MIKANEAKKLTKPARPAGGLRSYQNGQAVIASVIFLVLLSVVIIAGFATPLTRQLKAVRATLNSRQSYFAAESGVEDAVYRIKNNLAYPSSYNLTVGTAAAAVAVNTSGNTRTITVGGNQSNHFRKVKTKLISTNINPQFFYGAQAGEGGVKMEENSRIEGVGGVAGNLYSNGPVVGANGARVTGDVIVATGIALADQSTTCNTDQIAGQTNPQIDFAQSFKATDSKPLAKVSLYLKKVGNPDDRTIKITADNNGSPASNALASGNLTASLVTTNYGWIDVVFASPPNLTTNTTYWLILDADRDNNKYWVWCRDTNNGYGNGIGKYKQSWSTGGAWTTITGDLTFKTYLGTGFSSIDNLEINGSARANNITNSKICGDAYYQTIDSSSLNFLNNPSSQTCSTPLTNGTSYPGSADPPVAPLPLSQANIDQWKTDAASGGTISGNCGDNGVAGCAINDEGTLSLGPKKINGNLVLTKKQTLIVTGTLYFTGYLDMDSSSGATIKCDPSFGANSCVVVFDSWLHIKNNSIFQGSGTAGSYILMLTTLAGCNGGDQTAPCTHHNGAIDLHNNATGAIFYAANGLINLHNGVNVSEVMGYKINIDNTAVVTYEQGLLNASFSSGPGISFVIDSWKETE